MIDGGDNTDDTIGGALQNFSLEDVQEFKIQTQQYKAEYGRSTGGVLNVVTQDRHQRLPRQRLRVLPRQDLELRDRVGKVGRKRQVRLSARPVRRLGRRTDRQRQRPLLRHVRADQSQDELHGEPGRRRVYPNLDGAVISIPFKDDARRCQGHRGHLGRASSCRCASATRRTATSTAPPRRALRILSAPSPTSTPRFSAAHQAQISAEALNEFLFQYTKFDNTISPDSKQPLDLFPQRRHLRPEPQHTAVDAPGEVSVQGRLQLLHADRRASATTSSSASTSSTSRRSAAISRSASTRRSLTVSDTV